MTAFLNQGSSSETQKIITIIVILPFQQLNTEKIFNTFLNSPKDGK